MTTSSLNQAYLLINMFPVGSFTYSRPFMGAFPNKLSTLEHCVLYTVGVAGLGFSGIAGMQTC